MTHPASRPADDQLLRGRHSFADFELIFLTDGTCLFDGGAMFGVVPRTLWSQRMTPDADNRVLLGLNTLVVRTGHALVVIETGLGNKLLPKMQAIFGSQGRLLQSFAAAGIAPGDVTHVLNTHLHFDHCGWNTTLEADGTVRPTFPNARYFAHRGEVEHGHLQLDRDRVSYLSPNYDPLIASRQMTLLDAETLARDPGIVPGLWVEPFPGHTANMLAVHVAPGGPRASSRANDAPHVCYAGDLFPTTAHLDPTWCMAFDLDPLTTIEQRKRYLARAVPERWLTVFTHDHHVPAATIVLNEKGKPVAEPLFRQL